MYQWGDQQWGWLRLLLHGLIRQYLPKRQSMAHLTQRHCSRIALKLNNRPRKRLGFLTPKECYEHYSKA